MNKGFACAQSRHFLHYFIQSTGMLFEAGHRLFQALMAIGAYFLMTKTYRLSEARSVVKANFCSVLSLQCAVTL